LQHRGQESSGIVSSDGNTLHAEIGMGLVADVFNERRLAKLPGHMAIGHNRYSTTGSSLLRNAQPMVIRLCGRLAGHAHNGNLVNAMEIRRELEQQGAIFRSTTDTEVIVHLIARSAEIKLDRPGCRRAAKSPRSLFVAPHDREGNDWCTRFLWV